MSRVGATPSVVFTEQYYYPEGWAGAQLPRDITIHLARSGFDVEVICGSDPYAPVDGSPIEDPRLQGVRIVRVPRVLRGDIHSLKLLRQAWFYLCVLPLLAFRRSPALFVTQTNPPLLVPIVALAAWLKQRPFVIIAQDIYPEVMFAHGMVKRQGIAASILGSLFRWAYRRAERVVSLGPTMTQRLIEKGVRSERVTEVSNWATGDESIVRGAENMLRPSWDLTGKFVVLYSGNIGIAHDVETPILGLKTAIARAPNIRLVVVGKGSRLEEAKALVRAHHLDEHVIFRSLVPTELLPHSLGLADLALVTLKRGFEGLVVPSKLLGYMARGLPTMYVGPPSDAQSILEASRGGVCVANDDVDRFATALVEFASAPQSLTLMGSSAARYYDAHLSRDVALAKYLDLFRSLCATPISSRRRRGA
jgi:glycosyltransferase involved in cell wall biosynthesis